VLYFQSYVMSIGFDFIELSQVVHVLFVGTSTSLDIILKTIFVIDVSAITGLTSVYEFVLQNLAQIKF